MTRADAASERGQVALELLARVAHRVERPALLLARARERSACAALDARAGLRQLLRLRLDLGERRLGLLLERLEELLLALGLLLERLHARDDLAVLPADPAQVVRAHEQVVEAVGLEHDDDQVRLRRTCRSRPSGPRASAAPSRAPCAGGRSARIRRRSAPSRGPARRGAPPARSARGPPCAGARRSPRRAC